MQGDQEGVPQLRGRAETLGTAALVLGVLASIPLLVHPWFDFQTDASLYILTARSLLSGEGYSHLGLPFILRPPGMSLLIAPVLTRSGTDFLGLNLLVLTSGALAVLLLYRLERPRLGWPLALLVALCVWLNPAYQRFATQVMSDVPGLALLLGCLLLERRAARRPSWWKDLLLGVAIGLGGYLRTLLLLLAPAVAASRLLREPGRRETRRPAALAGIALLLGATVLVQAPWALRNRAHHPPPPVDQTLVYDYWTGMFRLDRGNPDSPRIPLGTIVSERVPARSAELVGTLGSRMQNLRRSPPELAFAALLLVAAAVSLLRRREPADFFLFATLAVVLVYFGYFRRLALPIYVLALPSAAALLRDATQRLWGARIALALPACALLALLLWDFHPRRGWQLLERSHRTFAAQCQQLQAALEPELRLASAHGVDWQVFLQRPVHSLRFAIRRSGDETTAEKLIAKYEIDAVFIQAREEVDTPLLRHLRAHHPAPRRIGSAWVFDVR